MQSKRSKYLKQQKILTIFEGVMPQQDYEFLYEADFREIFGPDAPQTMQRSKEHK